MKNKIAKLCALFIIFVVVGSSINGMVIAANNSVIQTVDAQNGMVNDTTPNFTTSSSAIIYVPDDYSTIQAAVNAASDGDTIIVRDGTYIENINVDKRLTIRSENGSDCTLVQAQNPNDHIFDVRADYVNISGFTVKGSNYSNGIYLGGVDHCNITDNKALDNWIGIYLYQSSNNAISNNNVSNNYYGIRLYSSSNNTISNNTANSNNYDGIRLVSSSNNTISSNTANSNNDHGIVLYDSSNNTISSNNALNNYDGIRLYYSSDNTISNNNASNNDHGIVLYSSSNNTLSGNTMRDDAIAIWGSSVSDFNSHEIDVSNTVNGKPVYYWKDVVDGTVPAGAGQVILANSTGVTVSGQNVSDGSMGILLAYSSGCTISNNTANSNHYGIYLSSSSSNTISNNTVNSNKWGINLSSSSSNTIANNNASNNDDGIYLSSSSNNTIYNNYLNNTNNAYDDGNNTWNISKTFGTNIINGSYLGGSYWSDYTGEDLDGDGLGDTPYNISGGTNKDYLPLVESTSADPDIWVDPTSFNVTLSTNTTQNYTLTIGNNGSSTLTYNISDANATTSSSSLAQELMVRTRGLTTTEADLSVGPKPRYRVSSQHQTIIESTPIEASGIEACGNEMQAKSPSQMVVPQSVGEVITSFAAPGSGPLGLAWDGEYLWNADWETNRIYKLSPSTGSVVQSFSSPGTLPFGLTYDGTYLWVAGRDPYMIYQLNPATGSVIRSIPSPGTNPEGLTWDGEYLWVAEFYDNKIYKLNPSDGAVVQSFDWTGTYTAGLAWDGTYLWHCDPDFDTIYKLNPTDGSVITSFSSPSTFPGGLTWDGQYIWNSDSSQDRIYQIDVGAEQNCSWLTETPTSGSVTSGNYDNITVSINTTGLSAGTYSANINISSNDPDEASTVVPVNLTVSTTEEAGTGGLETIDLNSGPTPTTLANTLMGGGVTVSNVTYSGVNISAGTFSNGTDIIGFYSGIILSSGNISNVIGPNTYDGTSKDNGMLGDADLDTLIPGYDTYDASVLEFDFVPDTDVVTFEYVFGSEEYNEYVHSEFNDVFGFFINGVNHALIPGTSTPVSINNVNGGNPYGTNANNSAYYRNNDLDDGGGSINTELDGLTIVLSVTASVNAGEINHIKLAIADAGDYILDSDVFIKAESFIAPNLTLSPITATNPVDINHTLTATLIENGSGASGRTITFNVTDGPNAGLTATNTTNSEGQATWSYASSVNGTDTIVATSASETSNTAYVIWQSFIEAFDTGTGTSPSISGMHNGTIVMSSHVNVSYMYTYPCAGTGGHAESVKIWNSTWNTTATWTGYSGDYHNISFDEPFILRAGETYNYTIETGSYPQIIHATSMEVTGGTITCTQFTDVNCCTYNDWVPAIRLG